MIGIYKITSPSGKIYIGQTIDLQRRQNSYRKLGCKGQAKLYHSLVKYGFCEHIFEVVEECSVEDLNIRERHWQDFYNVLGEMGLNCILTGTDDTPRVFSQETKNKISENSTAFYQTDKGKEVIQRRVANTDQAAKVANTDYTTIVANTDYAARTAKTDYAAFQERRIFNTDFAAKIANTDYAAFQEKRLSNINYKTRTANTDWEAKAKKCRKAILQISKDGTLIRQWSSGKEASEVLAISRGDISTCCKGKLKTAGGFIWKYCEK